MRQPLADSRLFADVFVVAAELIDNAAVRLNLDDAVCDGLDEFVVVRREENAALKGDQPLVDRGDGLKVQMVGRLVEHEHIRTEEHHPGKHAAHLFAAGEHLDRFVDLVAGEQHLAEEAAQEGLAGVL